MSAKAENPSHKNGEEGASVCAPKSVFGGKAPNSEEKIIESLQSSCDTLMRTVGLCAKLTSVNTKEAFRLTEQSLRFKNELDKAFREWYGRAAKNLSAPDTPVCPQCGFALRATTQIVTDGKRQDGQNYICPYCYTHHPSGISLWHLYFRDGKLDPGNRNTAN